MRVAATLPEFSEWTLPAIQAVVKQAIVPDKRDHKASLEISLRLLGISAARPPIIIPRP